MTLTTMAPLLLAAFAAGYLTRAYISYRRRQRARLRQQTARLAAGFGYTP